MNQERGETCKKEYYRCTKELRMCIGSNMKLLNEPDAVSLFQFFSILMSNIGVLHRV